MHPLFENYDKIPGISERLLPRIRKLCGERLVDILLHMPTAVTEKKKINSLDEAFSGQNISIDITIDEHKTGKGRRSPHRILTHDAQGEMLELIFFNFGKWMAKSYPVGKTITVTGKVDFTLSGKQMVHPESSTVLKTDRPKGFYPTYPLTAGVTHKTLYKAIDYALLTLKQFPLKDWLDEDLKKQYRWPDINDSFEKIHHPDDCFAFENNFPAKERLAFDELFSWQIALGKVRTENKDKHGISHQLNTELRNKFQQSLPFSLTGDQRKSLADIDANMADTQPMLRLVQGDVGSGKTVVAFNALLNSVNNGYQGVMMAPTEILAIQHYNNAKQWLEPLGVRIGLLTGKFKAKEKREIKQKALNHEIDILIGTHALIQEDVLFDKVSLVIIDEQHRFGVRQRLALTNQPETPDLLVMTATPIPRTLALTAYGDMDISIIAEKPPGRTPIETRVMAIEKAPEIANSLSRVIEKEEQVYWICPLVDESEKSDLAAATARYETLKQIFGETTALLHGRMKGTEKEETLKSFRDGKQKILVSTTVVEVGLDVPQATVMVIEHAERFGLAQLHQLRGRIGRGELASTCLLLYAQPLSQYGKDRLNAMRDSSDGFYLAEKDLELRGPGEVLGTAQSGHAVTKIANLFAHKDLIPVARDKAREGNIPSQATHLLTMFKKTDAQNLVQAG